MYVRGTSQSEIDIYKNGMEISISTNFVRASPIEKNLPAIFSYAYQLDKGHRV